MKIVKTLILYIKTLKFRHDTLKFEKQAKEMGIVNASPGEFIEYLSKGEELKRRSYEISDKLEKLK